MLNITSINRVLFSFKFTAVVTIIAAVINIYYWLSGNIETIFTGYIVNPLATMKIITSISFMLLASIYFINNKKIVKTLVLTGVVIQCVQFLLILLNIDTTNNWALSAPITLILFCISFLSFYFIKVKTNKISFLVLNSSLYVLSTFAVFSYLLNAGEITSYRGFETLSWNTSILFFINSISLFELKLVKIIDKIQLKNIALSETRPYKYYPFFFLAPILLITVISILTYINILTVLDSSFIIILFLSISSFISMFAYSYNFIKHYVDINKKSKQLEIKNNELKKLNKHLKLLNKAINKKKTYLEDFATITSHSLREPIVALDEIDKITNLTPTVEGFSKEQVNEMYSSSILRLNQGINSLVNYHKFIKNEDKKQKEEISLSKSIKDTYKNLEYLKPKNTELDLDITSDPVLTKIYINNILEQLFNNSFKFKKNVDPLKIKIIGYKTKNTYNILFKNNGIGFNLKEHKKADIFKKGRRFHYQSSASNGYGLYFVKLYVKKLKGEINAFSVKDKGTAFRLIIKLPHE